MPPYISFQPSGEGNFTWQWLSMQISPCFVPPPRGLPG